MLTHGECGGLSFKPKLYQVYGSLWTRGHAPFGSLGSDYINVLKVQADKFGIPIALGHRVTRVYREKQFSGKVLGVECEANGKKLNIRCKNLVLATGGFGANPKMRALHDPRMLNLTTTNLPCSTGDLIPLMQDIGAEVTGMDHIQCNPGCPPGRKHRVPFHQGSRFIIVNHEAKRFIKEDARRDVIRDAVLNCKNQTAWGLFDNVRFKMINIGQQQAGIKGLETGDAWKADTIEELAQKMGLDPKALRKTVDEWNAICKSGVDPLGKAKRNFYPIETPPFWGCYVGMSVHHTMGGLVINTSSQVIDRHGEVIPHVYAAGEVTGGIHGANRLGGNAIADCFTFGRLIGTNLAKASMAK